MNLTTKNHWGDDTTLAAEEVAAGDGLDTTAAVVGDHKDHVTKTVKKKTYITLPVVNAEFISSKITLQGYYYLTHL